MKRFDERDIIFSRMGYKEGTQEYKDYYKRNLQKEKVDAELRSMNDLCTPGTPTYIPLLAPLVEANFELISSLRQQCDVKPNGDKADVKKEDVSRLIKNIALHYGAADVGIAYADENYYYTYRGRHIENYGEPVDTSLKYAIVFTVKMDKNAINTAPAMPTAVESSKAYVNGAVIGLQIANYLANLGFRARCHMDSNYLMPAIPIAVKAGLGEVGRNNLLISKKNGCFVRIGMVTTELELITDEPESLDVERFCRLCGRCAKTCPARTISHSQDSKDWVIEQEKCYKIWRSLGTDCGICISACPIGQELPAERIKDMTDVEIQEFLDDYTSKYGSRNRNAGKVFL